MKNINLRERLRRLLNKEIGPLTTSQHLLRSTRARLENNKGVASKEYSIGALKSLTRGAFVGGVGGVIGSFGNIPAALAVSMVFGTLDLGQYGLRIINLAFWGKGNPQGYAKHLSEHYTQDDRRRETLPPPI